MACVPRGYGMMFAARGEFLQSIGARRVEQSVKHPPVAGPRYYERFVDKSFYRALDFRPVNFSLLHNRERRLQRKVPDEDRDTSQHDSFDLGKVIVAPVQRRSERLMPPIRSSATELQEIEARSELRHRVSDAEDSRSSGGELDG